MNQTAAAGFLRNSRRRGTAVLGKSAGTDWPDFFCVFVWLCVGVFVCGCVIVRVCVSNISQAFPSRFVQN